MHIASGIFVTELVHMFIRIGKHFHIILHYFINALLYYTFLYLHLLALPLYVI